MPTSTRVFCADCCDLTCARSCAGDSTASQQCLPIIVDRARPWRSTARSTRQPPAAEGAGFRRLPTDLEGGVVESRHGLAQRRRKGTRRAFRKRPGDAGGRAALHPLHARQQNNIGSIGRRMDSPAAAPTSPREHGATATPPRRSPPRVSAPPLRHRCDRPSPPCCFAVVPWCLRCYSGLPLFAAL